MRSFHNIIKSYTIKHDSKIAKICSPLKNHLGISIFTYYKIDNEGNFLTLSNFPEQMDFYYEQQLYMTNPFLVHPSLLRPGCVFTETTPDENYQLGIKMSREQFHMHNPFLIINKNLASVEGFLFGNKIPNSAKIPSYLNWLELLKKFCGYFKQEAEGLLGKMASEQFNIQKVKEKAFFERAKGLPLSNQEPCSQRFLESISPLSLREQQCLEYYLEGRSAQSTAAILGLSRRTVEHYFENIKVKLNCRTKSEIYAKAKYLK